MTLKSALCIALLATSLPALAREEPQAEVHGFLVGSYQIVGKRLGSNDTYQGVATIEVAGDHVEITKQVGGQQMRGTGRVEAALGGDAQVLKLRYREAGVEYEGACLFRGDLDNYARITCHLYHPGVYDPDPGLEAWFIRHPSPDAASGGGDHPQ